MTARHSQAFAEQESSAEIDAARYPHISKPEKDL